jgi:hypothetical protein
MTRYRLKYLRNEAIDDVTAQPIREYEAKAGVPVPVDEIVEQVLGLDFDWDVIQEQPGEQILGGLDAENRKILLNEAHTDLFDEKPGLLRSTIGHEAGHRDVDIDRAKQSHPMFSRIDLALNISLPDPEPCRASVFQAKREVPVEKFRAEWETICAEPMKGFVELFPGPRIQRKALEDWITRFKERQF